ncbi:MAG: ATP-binding cassette domain-containing protein [Alphaproteobacteria bacterium]|nr:ATP-binding cassette domain-containing protein [Alphaproteobacteria bacterium]
MIQLDNVSLTLQDRPVLRDISLTLSERRIAIIGANGSGKSSLARLFNGLVLPTEGRVRVDGWDTAADGRKVRRAVGFVFQNPDNQIVMPTVAEDLAFGLKPLRLDADEQARRIDGALARYGLESHRDHPAYLLSGGQKQLLALAGVLVMDPAWIVLDEPTTLLDLRNVRAVLDAIAALDQRVVLVTHALEHIRDFDRVIVLDEGRVLADDTPGPAIARYLAALA